MCCDPQTLRDTYGDVSQITANLLTTIYGVTDNADAAAVQERRLKDHLGDATDKA